METKSRVYQKYYHGDSDIDQGKRGIQKLGDQPWEFKVRLEKLLKICTWVAQQSSAETAALKC